MQSKNNSHVLANNYMIIGLILLCAIILRLISIQQSFWLDEAINVLAVNKYSLTQLLTVYAVGDFHPPLFHLMLWSWSKVTSSSEFFMRLPSVVFGVATVYVIFLIGKLIAANQKERFIPIVSAVLLATSGLHIYYSQEARMYSLAAFLSTLTLLFLLQIKQKPSKVTNTMYIVVLTLMLYADYQPWLLIPLLIFIVPIQTIVSLFLTVPLWPLIASQLKIGLSTASDFPLWGDVVGKLSAKSLLLVPVKFLVGRVSVENNIVFGILLLIPILIAAVAIFRALKHNHQTTNILLGWILLPLTLGALIAVKVPVFSYFRFIFLLPAVYLLIAVGFSRLTISFRKLAIAGLILTNIISSSAYLLLTRFHREDWRGVMNYANSLNQNSLIMIPNLAQSAGVEMYNSKNIKIQDKNTINLSSKPTEVLFIRYVQEIFDPYETINTNLQKDGYEKVQEKSFQGVLVWHYTYTGS